MKREKRMIDGTPVTVWKLTFIGVLRNVYLTIELVLTICVVPETSTKRWLWKDFFANSRWRE